MPKLGKTRQLFRFEIWIKSVLSHIKVANRGTEGEKIFFPAVYINRSIAGVGPGAITFTFFLSNHSISGVSNNSCPDIH